MLLDVFLEKFQSLHGNLVASGFHATPDRGRLGNDLDIHVHIDDVVGVSVDTNDTKKLFFVSFIV